MWLATLFYISGSNLGLATSNSKVFYENGPKKKMEGRSGARH
jgi:hypothetical protein